MTAVLISSLCVPKVFSSDKYFGGNVESGILTMTCPYNMAICQKVAKKRGLNFFGCKHVK